MFPHVLGGIWERVISNPTLNAGGELTSETVWPGAFPFWEIFDYWLNLFTYRSFQISPWVIFGSYVLLGY